MTNVIRFNEAVLDEAARKIANGGVIVLPTDTVYGIGCAFSRGDAIERIFSIKRRDPNKSIAVLIAELDQISQLTDFFPPSALALAEKFWPGALTLVVPKKNGLPENLSLAPTVGLRLPDHELTRELIRRSGPLATTSANLSGTPPANAVSEIPGDWFDQLDLVLDGGRVLGGQASTVVDCSGEPLRILREGAISAAALGLSPEEPR